jgi:C-terminal processing protease CtpA/Prc
LSPVIFNFIEGKAVITQFYNDSIAQRIDLRIGDVLSKIDGNSVDSLFKENRKYINGSNLSFKKYNAYYYLLSGSNTPLNLEINRNGTS